MIPQGDSARPDAEVRQTAAAFAHPIPSGTPLPLVTSFAGCAAMPLVLPIDGKANR